MVKYDVIIIGAGSVGVPATMAIARKGLKVLCLDKNPSSGQGDNKHAIGGIRATHSQKAKIWICLRSLEILRNWQDKYGDDIDWIEGGYLFVAYTKEDEKMLKETVEFQKKQGLNIDWIDADKIQELIPGINPENLLGGTFSPEDGSASSLLINHAFHQQALKAGAEFRFEEPVTDILTNNGKVTGIKTTKGEYQADQVINAAGAYAKEVAAFAGVDIPVKPDSHEAGITEPVERFFSPMIVDIRPEVNKKFGNSKNYYFYQNGFGQIIFCITPDPPKYGIHNQETSEFLPQVSQRMIDLLPRIRNIKVRRTWRGSYPMTPDGSPIIGSIKELEGYINAVGMCGQGLMIGPGLGEVLARIVTNELTEQDQQILKELSLYRDFSGEEALK
jgi:sarcosine oxidase subunit beta